MRPQSLVYFILFIVGCALPANAEQSFRAVSGKGGAFLNLHNISLEDFDPELAGVPLVIGGEGYSMIGNGIRLGGAGGGGFLWGANDRSQFAMGYGGLFGEYPFKPWLNVRVLLGAGGFAVSKGAGQSSPSALQKIDSGGFLVVFPSVGCDFQISSSVRLGGRLGLFLPNVNHLQSIVVGIHVLFGGG